MTTDFAQRETREPTTSVPARMAACMWRQAERSAICPEGPRLDGRLALVSGGSRGIGLETSRGLAGRGAEVVSAARGADVGRRAVEAMQQEFDRDSHFLPLDLGDLVGVERALESLATLLGGRRLEVLVANAGLWPTRHALSAQGHEIAFATNVLGHHALLRGAQARGLLAERARIVVVTGDIYVMARACTPDYRYRGPLGGQIAYCRSKLGNLWMVREWARREPALEVLAVHPGVIASDLGGESRGVVGAVKRALMLSTAAGAQTSLFCATWPGLESGGYWHNTMGRVTLRADDPGADDDAAAALWDRLEALREATA